MPGSITNEDRIFVETWESLTERRTAIVKLTARGDETRQLITKGTFMCTTEERILTQDLIANQKDDPFLNGRFRPVVVPATITVETNPNALSDAEIEKVLKSSDLAFGEWLTSLDSLETLSRMRNLALGMAGEVTLARFQQIEARLDEVRPGPVQVQTKDRQLLESMG